MSVTVTRASPARNGASPSGDRLDEVVLVEDDPGRRAALAAAIQDVATVRQLRSVDDLEQHGGTGGPFVAVCGPSQADTIGLAALERVVRSRPAVGVVLVVEELTTEALHRAMRAGVRDVVAMAGDGGALADAVRRVALSLDAYSGRGGDETSARDHGRSGELVTVFSTKGGAGKSVVATNLGASLARRGEGRVVLIDADLQFGDVAVMMKLAPEHTIVEAVTAIDRLDAQLLEDLLIRHEPSGLLVLPAPLEPAFADQVTPAHMAKIVRLLRSMCSYVVVDLPNHFGEVVLGLLEESDHICLIGGLEIPTIKNVKLGLQTLRLLGVPMSKIKLVVNRSNSKVRLDVGELERTLQLKAAAQIPSDLAVPQSLNKGLPVVLDAPRSEVARSFEELAELFVPAAVAAAGSAPASASARGGSGGSGGGSAG